MDMVEEILNRSNGYWIDAAVAGNVRKVAVKRVVNA